MGMGVVFTQTLTYNKEVPKSDRTRQLVLPKYAFRWRAPYSIFPFNNTQRLTRIRTNDAASAKKKTAQSTKKRREHENPRSPHASLPSGSTELALLRVLRQRKRPRGRRHGDDGHAGASQLCRLRGNAAWRLDWIADVNVLFSFYRARAVGSRERGNGDECGVPFRSKEWPAVALCRAGHVDTIPAGSGAFTMHGYPPSFCVSF